MPSKEAWCPACGAQHPAQDSCPGDLPPHGPERHSWRTTVNMRHGTETVGVVVAPVGTCWRARIITYPSEFWTVSRGAAVMKFYADSPEAAEQDAVDHVETFIQNSGLTLATEFLPVRFETEVDPDGSAGRRLCSWKVRFGHNTMNREAALGNVSEKGIFLQTADPLPAGSVIRMELDVAGTRIPLRGTVAWVRLSRETGRPLGMGVRLARPPAMYLDAVRKLT